MIEIKDTIEFNEFGFDGDKYIELQKNQILDRMVNSGGRLYLEIGGSIIKNYEAQRILPGYSIDTMKKIFSNTNFSNKIEILYCIKSDYIIQNKNIEDENTDMSEYIERKLLVIERTFGVKPVIVITDIDVGNMFDIILSFERKFQKKQYRVFEKYKISGYPTNLKSMLSEDGFGADDHIPLTKNLILVGGFGYDCGKYSTCLGQIYLDNEIGIRSNYARFQTLPIRNLSINHPINLVYQALLLHDNRNLIIDEKHKKNYNQDAVISDKESEKFDVLQNFAKATVNHKNYMIKYNSSVDVNINCTGMCISNDEVIKKACLQEIQCIKKEYELNGNNELVEKCQELYILAEQWKK